jgi:preprotein translocase subunit SecY
MKVIYVGRFAHIFAGHRIAAGPVGLFVPSSQTARHGWYKFLQFSILSIADDHLFQLIVASAFLRTIQFNPIEVANNLRRTSGFVPGFRPASPRLDFMARYSIKFPLRRACISVVAFSYIQGNVIGVKSLPRRPRSSSWSRRVETVSLWIPDAHAHYKGFWIRGVF